MNQRNRETQRQRIKLKKKDQSNRLANGDWVLQLANACSLELIRVPKALRFECLEKGRGSTWNGFC